MYHVNLHDNYIIWKLTEYAQLSKVPAIPLITSTWNFKYEEQKSIQKHMHKLRGYVILWRKFTTLHAKWIIAAMSEKDRPV